ncbi:YaiI/YqxD family protein [Bacillus mojavensis]|uniref:YaiI/YqxD family protein n=1 Tax=Bacillus mojavensis TaxID=72360 RepID=UPI002DBB5ADD|nr:YaiI/YqxD family protein [Bacillus mojavensis]MEC1623493.1 YaiI/YqxD family protein [Bacillus mojavensis]MEC1661478.1 YaiI/YqxD family protein [Bacillus mojavensis]
MEGWRITLLNEKEKAIFVDADACPVKDEILQTASDYEVQVLFVASFEHYQLSRSQEEKWKYVDPHKEAADLYIANHVKPGDVVVTQDIGLASLLLNRNVTVMSERGRLYKEDTIDIALEGRHVSGKQRRKGIYAKGPKKLNHEDRERFVTLLQKILSNDEGILH